MGFETKANAIRTLINTNWTKTPIAWDNVKFDPPSNGPYIAVSILEAETFHAAIGVPKMTRTSGVIAIQIFDLIGRGDGTVREYGDDLSDIFIAANLSGITLLAPSFVPVGPGPVYWQGNLSVAFWYDEHH